MKLNESKTMLLIFIALLCSAPFLRICTATVTPLPNQAVVTGALAADLDITSAIQTKLSQDPNIANTHIMGSTQDGVVTLEGTVDSQVQVDEATNIAKSVSGVKSVAVKIVVKITPVTRLQNETN